MTHDKIFIGEVGVHDKRKKVMKDGLLETDYDRDNPSGLACGRRNYNETAYLSGRPDAYPSDGRLLFAAYYN